MDHLHMKTSLPVQLLSLGNLRKITEVVRSRKLYNKLFMFLLYLLLQLLFLTF